MWGVVRGYYPVCDMYNYLYVQVYCIVLSHLWKPFLIETCDPMWLISFLDGHETIPYTNIEGYTEPYTLIEVAVCIYKLVDDEYFNL